MKKLYIFLIVNSAYCIHVLHAMEVPKKKSFFGTLRNRIRSASFSKHQPSPSPDTPRMQYGLTREELDAWAHTAATFIKLYEDSSHISDDLRTKAIDCLLLGLENKDKDHLLEDDSMWATEHDTHLSSLYEYYGTWGLVPVQQETLKSLWERAQGIDAIKKEQYLAKLNPTSFEQLQIQDF